MFPMHGLVKDSLTVNVERPRRCYTQLLSPVAPKRLFRGTNRDLIARFQIPQPSLTSDDLYGVISRSQKCKSKSSVVSKPPLVGYIQAPVVHTCILTKMFPSPRLVKRHFYR